MAKGFRHGAGGELRKVPVLNEAYPNDVTAEDVGNNVAFEVVIAEAGSPATYTYQWYYDNSAVDGATSNTYTRSAENGSHSVYCIVTNKAGSVRTRTATVTTKKLYLYKTGNECKDISGGWSASSWRYYGNTTAATPSISKKSSYIQISFNENSGTVDGCIKTKNKISVTDYDRLVLTCDSDDVINVGHVSLVSSTSSGVMETVATSLFTVSASNLEVDVSDITGSYYVCVGMALYDRRTASLKMSNVYVE